MVPSPSSKSNQVRNLFSAYLWSILTLRYPQVCRHTKTCFRMSAEKMTELDKTYTASLIRESFWEKPCGVRT